jgi:hypothetical protein
MTREELMALLRDPDQTGQSVDELNRLIEEYSYFHTGHQLYLQSLKKTDETRLTHHLNRSALSVRDRGVLYNYINRPNIFRQQVSEPEGESNILDDIVTPFAPGNAFVSPEGDIAGSRYGEIPTPAGDSAQASLPGGEEGSSFKDISTYTVSEEKIMSDSELLAIIQRQLEQIEPVSSQTEEKLSGTGKQTSEAANESTDGNESSIISEEALIAGLQNAGNVPDTKTVDTAQNENPDKGTAGDNSAETSIAKLPKQKSIESNTIEDIIEQSVGKSENTGGDDLIDTFIKTNPKIVPADTDFQADLSESLKDSSDTATETLADIYVSQGHIQKAVEIYEYLILKYPKKHIYFAAQINRLKRELKK